MYTAKSEKGEEVQINFDNNQVIINDETLDISFQNQLNGNFIIHQNNQAIKAEVLEMDDAKKKFTIKIDNGIYNIDLKDQTDALLEKLGMTHLQNVIIKDIKAKKKRQKKGEGPSADSMLKNFKERDDEVEKQSE